MEIQRRTRKKLGAAQVIGRTALVLFTTVIALAASLAIMLATIVKGPSRADRSTFVTTVLESGNLKFLASLFLNEQEIQEIVDESSMAKMEKDIDSEIIDTESGAAVNFDEN